MPILHKFNELDYLALAVPVRGCGCNTCILHAHNLGCIRSNDEENCSVIMKEIDGTALYVFKGLVER